MSAMSEAAPCPPTDELNKIVQPDDYAEFNAGWRDGLLRCAKNPAPIEVIEDIALLLCASELIQRINPPE